jgi:type I restriction enzyme S subunit
VIKLDDKQLFDLPNGWSWVKLEELVASPRNDIVDGPFGSDMKASEYVEQGVPIIRLQNIKRNLFLKKNIRYISSEKAKQLDRHSFRKNDIVITKLGAPLGKACLVPSDFEKGVIVADVVRLRVDEQFVSRKYLVFAINSDTVTTNLNLKTKGTTRPRVNLGQIRSLTIPLAPLNEQKHIAGKVEAFFAESKTAREALDKVLVLLRRFRQSVLARAFRGGLTKRDASDEPAQKLLVRIRQERNERRQAAFIEDQKEPTVDLPKLPETWTWTTIGELETFIGSGITPRGGKEVYRDEGIPFIRSQNVQSDGLHLEDVAYITPEMHAEMKRTQVRPNDVLLNITGASIGRSTYIPEVFGEANVNQHVCIIRTGWWIVPAYLAHFLNSRCGQDQISATESGVTREGLNYTQVRSLWIPLAPVAEQRHVATKIGEAFAIAEQIEKAVKKARERAERVDRAILAKAFRGELVPQDPNDEPASVLLQRIKAQESPMKASERKKHARFRESTYREHNKPLAHITSILREMGEATVEQVYDASGRSMENFWDELAREVKAGTIQEIRKGQIIYLKVKD